MDTLAKSILQLKDKRQTLPALYEYHSTTQSPHIKSEQTELTAMLSIYFGLEFLSHSLDGVLGY